MHYFPTAPFTAIPFEVSVPFCSPQTTTYSLSFQSPHWLRSNILERPFPFFALKQPPVLCPQHLNWLRSNTIERPFPFVSLNQQPRPWVVNSPIVCVPPLFRDRSLLNPSNKPQFIVFSPAPLTAFQHPLETIPFCITQQSHILYVLNNSNDCCPTPFRERSLLNPSSNHQLIVFWLAPLTAFQHLWETVPFCIPQTRPNSICFHQLHDCVPTIFRDRTLLHPSNNFLFFVISTAALTAFQHF
jgi:hypothetical protein